MIKRMIILIVIGLIFSSCQEIAIIKYSIDILKIFVGFFLRFHFPLKSHFLLSSSLWLGARVKNTGV